MNLMPININLLEQKPGFKSRMFYCGMGALVLAIFGLISGGLYLLQSHELNNQQAVNINLHNEVHKYQNEMEIFKPILDMSSDMNLKEQKLADIEKDKTSYSDLMMEIDGLIPAKITLVEVEIKEKRVVMTGFSPDHSQVARLLYCLKGSNYFNNINVLSSQMNEKTNEIRFTIEMEWEAAKR